ncbi:MAG: 5'-nucleotidase, lipoprotein e(P4) family [Salinivenus sp.]
MTRSPWIAALVLLLIAGCGTSRPAAEAPSLQERADSLARVADSLETVADEQAEAAQLRNPLLYATLWTQTAVEYDGVTRGAYRLAELMMDRALADSSWSADLEQADRSPDAYRDKPPAVVLDVDETVLDNSAYQARLIQDNETFDSESWLAWCREEQADAVPGARAFTQRADSLGVQVIYLTNRDAAVEEATRENLKDLGFPVHDDPDAVLTQGERPNWEAKDPRRAWVADRYRVLLLIGDNLGDFTEPADTSLSARQQVADEHRSFWGSRWIALPNPQYGSWDGALFDYDYSLSPREQLREKRTHLESKRGRE